jgi:hypothetical protein
MVAIEQVTYDAVQAREAVTDLVLEGGGLEIGSETAMPLSARMRAPTRAATRQSVRTTHQEDIVMRAHGHVLAWGTQAGEGRVSDAKGWYRRLNAWWAAHEAARQSARMAALDACWDATHEAVRPLRAEAAAQGALTVATMVYGLSQ